MLQILMANIDVYKCMICYFSCLLLLLIILLTSQQTLDGIKLVINISVTSTAIRIANFNRFLSADEWVLLWLDLFGRLLFVLVR